MKKGDIESTKKDNSKYDSSVNKIFELNTDDDID
jgi:hypothetical protein